MLSLIAIGTPASGPTLLPAFTRSSTLWAAANAPASSTNKKTFSSALRDAIASSDVRFLPLRCSRHFARRARFLEQFSRRFSHNARNSKPTVLGIGRHGEYRVTRQAFNNDVIARHVDQSKGVRRGDNVGEIERGNVAGVFENLTELLGKLLEVRSR